MGDWGQQGYGQQPYPQQGYAPPPQQPQSWIVRPAEVGEMFTGFTLARRRATGGLIVTWLILQVAMLLTQIPRWVIVYFQQDALLRGDLRGMTQYSGISLCASGVFLIAACIIGGLMLGLFRPLRRSVLEGTPMGGAGEVFKDARTNLVPSIATLLIFGLAVGIGTVFCLLPGLAAFFFLGPSLYLVGGCDLQIGDALKKSYELALKNVGPMCVGIAIVIVAVAISAGINIGLTSILLSVMGAAGLFIAQPVAAILGLILGWFIFLFWGGSMIAMDAAARGVPLPAS